MAVVCSISVFRHPGQLQCLSGPVALARALRQDGIVLGAQTVSVEDYERVRTLLQTRLVAGADETCNPLAANMVTRANLHLAVKYGGGSDNPWRVMHGGEPRSTS